MVENMEESILALKKQRYILVSKPTEAVAFSGKQVSFLYHKDVGLIELVESPAETIE
jgi:methylmalonyl-CoA/ethylmalonyl-CoA epimerase